jgi:hypothetical protein
MYTVVIATLGNTNLIETINQINNGTLKPQEILICIPKEYIQKVQNLLHLNNIRIISTNIKGQVQQRIEGFKKVKTDFTIQLDDDILVDENCFHTLIKNLKFSGNNSAISPSLYFRNSKESCYKHTFFNSKLMRFIYCNNGDVNGKITKNGGGFGFDHSLIKNHTIELEWLPGGCVAHHTKNLIIENFYPFSGKAFYEDVYHSILLRKNGIKLFVSKTAICYIDEFEKMNYNPFFLVKAYIHDYKYKAHVLKLLNKTKFFLNVEFLYLLISVFYSYFKRNNK